MRLTYLLFLVLITFSCGSSDSNLYEIDPRDWVENKITLSDIADDIKYYPLDNSILFTNFEYVITPKFLYISAKGIGILKFDREGRLITKIGSRGRGPDEFWYGMDFTVDEKSGNVFVLDPSKVKVYSQSGIFLRDILLKQYLGGFRGSEIEIYNSLLFFPDYLPTGDSKYSWVFLDTLGNLVAKKENSVPSFQANTVPRGSIYIFENKLFIFNYINDTIFSISPDLSYQGTYLFAQGDHRWPRTRIETNTQSEFISQMFKLFKPGTMFETKHFIVLEFSYLDRGAISLIDKKTKKIFLALKYEETIGSWVKSKACIINDLDGGMPLSDIKYYSENGEEFITTLINPFDLKVYLTSDEFKNTVPKYPEKKKELEKLANSLKETDNPVLMIVRLKK
jgi:hypothetical protein